MSEGGCTNCGNKGGCDSRKHGMFAAIEGALARLYPTRRWGERDDAVALAEGIGPEEGEALAEAIGRRLGTATVFRAGDPGEWCDYIYVLCLGRTPCIAELRESLSLASGEGADEETSDSGGRGGDGADAALDQGDLEERYLRVALSSVARFAGVQEVSMNLRRVGREVIITETARGGVFDPVLLPRFQSLVAVLAATDVRHLDFGEIVEPPDGFDPADYADSFGAEAPVIANYLFYPQSPTTVTTAVFSPPG
jgi:hypothetical protein